MNAIFNNVESTLMSFGIILGTIGFIFLGLKAIFAFMQGGGLRQVFQGVGVVLVGIILIGASSALTAAVMNIAKSL